MNEKALTFGDVLAIDPTFRGIHAASAALAAVSEHAKEVALARHTTFAEAATKSPQWVARSPIRDGETAAIALSRPKTAALCFDRVWGDKTNSMPQSGVPDDIRFYDCHPIEFWCAALLALEAHAGLEDPMVQNLAVEIVLQAYLEGIRPNVGDGGIRAFVARFVSEAWFRKCGIAPVPVLDDHGLANSTYVRGDRSVIYAALSGIAVPNEDCLTWKQVMDFRRDRESVKTYRRLLHWLDAEMVGRPSSFVQDEIAERLDSYESALRKHGVRTLVATLSSLVDAKAIGAIAGISAAAATGHIGAALAGAGVLIGRAGLVCAHAALDRLDIRDSVHPEVAYFHSVKRAAG